VWLPRSGRRRKGAGVCFDWADGQVADDGEMSEEQATAAFAAQAAALAEAGADALLVETMSDIEEARLAVAAAKGTGCQ